jgi:hypothetical protein
MRQGCRQINLGTSTVIMCGGEPQDHKCDDNGPFVYDFSDGFRGTLFA